MYDRLIYPVWNKIGGVVLYTKLYYLLLTTFTREGRDGIIIFMYYIYFTYQNWNVPHLHRGHDIIIILSKLQVE